MAIDLLSSDFTELRPRILVFGVGGAGGNAVNNMVSSRLEGVEFVVANTDAQALVHSRAQHRLQIGSRLTQGLGAGSRPDIGEGAAEESADDIRRVLANAHMVFITAGMGGGTGTGGAPVIAKIAREMGILTIGVITKPFAFEGARRMRTAEDGIERLRPHVDTLIIVPNQNLFRIANEKTTFAKAFEMADEVLYAGVRGVTDLMVMPGLINLDFADVRTVMSEMGTAMMGMGEADGDDRAQEAAEAAISNPLLDVSSMKGAKGVLINITGGMDLTLYEVDEAANKIRQEVDPDANIIVGSTFDEKMNGRIRVSVVATGIAIESKAATQPARNAAAGDAQKRTATPGVATAPAGTAAIVREASNPVRALQADIIQAGLAVGGLPSTEPMGQNPVDARPFEPDLLADMPDIRRDMSRQRPLSAPLGAEAKKPGGFSVFGITIGGSSPKARTVARAAPLSASQTRIAGPGSAATPDGIGHRLRPEEISQAMADEKLDIPAFLRRQVN